METIKYIFAIGSGLLVLILLEGMFTLGAAFRFENYTWLGYAFQALLVIVTVCFSIMIKNEPNK